MLNVVAPGAVSSAANPILDVWTQREVTQPDGFRFFGLGAPHALAFQVWDVRDPDAPAQIFPATPGQRQAVDLEADRVGGVDGHYAAAWTVSPTSAEKGRYQIRWYVTDTDGGPERVDVRAFDVIPAAAAVSGAGTAYALVSDLREEGVGAEVSDARILTALALGARYIERVTRRVFRPVYKDAVFDGNGGRALLFGEPIIALAGVFLGQPPHTAVERSAFRVYNRHLSAQMHDPDDRDDPKIEFAHFSDLLLGRRGAALVGSPLFGVPWRDHYFPKAVQNVTVRGVWGYTEHDGSSTGATPALIVQAQKLLALRELPTMGCGADEREDRRSRHRLTSERTRDQSYTKKADVDTPFTGDREIDDVLTMFMAPMGLGSA